MPSSCSSGFPKLIDRHTRFFELHNLRTEVLVHHTFLMLVLDMPAYSREGATRAFTCRFLQL